MTLGRYLRLVLVGDQGVAALAGDRVYSEILEQGAKTPAVVYSVVGGSEDVALDGPTGSTVRRVQVDAWAETRAAATQLGLAVRAALAGHAGAAGGLEVQAIDPGGETWGYDPESKLYRVIRDFDVHVSGES